MAGVKRDITILCIVGCNGCVPNHVLLYPVPSLVTLLNTKLLSKCSFSIHSSSCVSVPVNCGVCIPVQVASAQLSAESVTRGMQWI